MTEISLYINVKNKKLGNHRVPGASEMHLHSYFPSLLISPLFEQISRILVTCFINHLTGTQWQLMRECVSKTRLNFQLLCSRLVFEFRCNLKVPPRRERQPSKSSRVFFAWLARKEPTINLVDGA